jgi:hypothetical protein
LTGTPIALWLAVLGTEVAPAMADNGPALIIDPCVAVDEATVREVMDLEIHGARTLPTAVTVRCIDGAQEIQVLPRSSPVSEAIRTIVLPPVADDDDAAARQARSRELALAIAEYIRRLDADQPPSEEPPEASLSSAPPPAVPPPSTPPLRLTDRLEDQWQLGLLSAVEHFSGGMMLVGGDVFAGSRLGRWFSAAVRTGGRIGTNVSLPGGRLSTRAATAAVAVGLNRWSPNRSVGTALLLRAQGYLVQFRAEQLGEGRPPTALLGALTLAAEPQLTLALTRHFSLEASAGVGFPLRGIVVNLQGTETRGMSGFIVAACFGGVVSF